MDAIATGAAQHLLPDPRPGPRRDLTVYTYRPEAFDAASPVVIVMHGRNRNGRDYRDCWIGEARARGFLVAVPEFSEASYAHPHEYNYGDMIRADGSLKPRDEWLFPVVDRVFEDVRARSGASCSRYFLFGHSAGAQVVHRLATFAWSPLIERAVSANAGSYTMPLFDETFPFGLGGTAFSRDQLAGLFARPLTILLGDQDIDAGHHQLPREPAAMRQGPHRFARGHRYLEVAQQQAANLGVPLAWRIAVAPGVAHSVGGIAPFAARLLFDDDAGTGKRAHG
jgi:poly(3-hydroxybutyrate) depolymerase